MPRTSYPSSEEPGIRYGGPSSRPKPHFKIAELLGSPAIEPALPQTDVDRTARLIRKEEGSAKTTKLRCWRMSRAWSSWTINLRTLRDGPRSTRKRWSVSCEENVEKDESSGPRASAADASEREGKGFDPESAGYRRELKHRASDLPHLASSSAHPLKASWRRLAGLPKVWTTTWVNIRYKNLRRKQ